MVESCQFIYSILLSYLHKGKSIKTFFNEHQKIRIKGAIEHYSYFLLFPFLSIIFFILILANKIFNLTFAMADNGRIGGILNLYCHLATIEYKSNYRGTLVVFWDQSTGIIANKQWDLMFKKKVISFSQPWFYRDIRKLITFYGFGSKLIHNLPKNVFYNSTIVNSVQNLKTPMLALTPEELNYGANLLEEKGISKSQKIICFHNRDSAYLNQVNSHLNWAYHDYRDSSVLNYLKAAESYIDKGYCLIRVGSIALEKLDPNDKIIDYANSNWRSDFLDIYLAERCTFFLCSDTGISVVPEIFQKPIVYVNWTLLPRMTNWVQFAVFIPKKFFCKTKNRLLTFHEMINDEHFFAPGRNADWEKFVIIENTPDEILEACLEMSLRIEGKWVEDEESLMLQFKFWSHYPKEYLRPKKLYIGTQFLKQNLELL